MPQGWTLDQARAPAPAAKGGGGFSLSDAQGLGGNSQPAPPPRSIWQRIGDALPSAHDAEQAIERGIGGVVRGAGEVAGLVGNPLNATLNLTGLPQRLTGTPLSTSLGETARDAIPLARPRNATERVMEDIQAGGAGGILTAGVGGAAAKVPGLVGKFAGFLGEAPVINTIAGAAGEGSSGVTREMGGGEVAQTVAGLVGGFGAGIGAHYAGRPRAPRPVDAPLEYGSLDGGIPDVAAFDPNASLRAAGADAAQFSPENVDRFAARADAARNRVPQNGLGPDELARHQALRDAIGMGETDPAFAPVPPVRTMPGDVPIIGAPEGNIRADDAGGVAGLGRTRAANEGVMGRAQALVEQDPLIGHILDSNVPHQTKLATIWQRIEALRNQGGDVPQFDPVDVSGADAGLSPWQQSTPDRARSAGRGPSSVDGMTNFIMRDLEGGGKRVVDSGGETRFGVSKNGNPDVNIAGLDEAGARDLYRTRYWNPIEKQVSGTSSQFQQVAYDAAVNHGVGKARQMIAASGGDVDALLSLRRAEYQRLIKSDPAKYGQYENGWNNRLAKMGGDRAPAGAEPYRAPAPAAPDEFAPTSPAERMDAQASPTQAELDSGAVFQNRDGIFTDQPSKGTRQYESPTATGGNERPFRATGSDPEGQPGHWEAEATRMQDDLAAKMRTAQEESARSAGARMEGDRTAGKQDASSQYRGKYDQRPMAAADGWTVNDGGFVAGKNGNPVAFRSAKEAATWAAKNKMGGDFDLAVWEANSKRVVLRRKEGSTYGRTPETGPQPAQGPAFDAATPAAGRSADRSQRLIGGAQAEPARPAPVAESAPAPIKPARLPEDALSFIAKNGGLRNDEGHALRVGGRELAQYAPQGGHVFRKNGMSIDRAGELLHEAGFFNERPTTADVLEMLDQSASKRQFRPRDQVDAEHVQAQQREVADRQRASDDLDAAAQGMDLTPEERTAIAARMDHETSASQAIEDHFADQLERKMQEGGIDVPHYEDAFPGFEPKPNPSADSGGTGGTGRSAGSEGSQGSDPAPVGDAGKGAKLPDEAGVAPTSEDRLATLDRVLPANKGGNEIRIDAPNGTRRVMDITAARREMLSLASKAGKFDDLYDRIMRWNGEDATIGDMKVATGRFEELDARGMANGVKEELAGFLHDQTDKAGVAKMIDAGLMEREAGFERARLTDAGRKVLYPKLARAIDSESGFITADMLLAPLRAAGNLVDWKGLRGDATAIAKTMREAVGDPKKALASTMGRLSRFGSSALYSADGSARSLADHFSSPTLTKFADLFHAEAGKSTGTARTYEEAVDRGMRTRIQQVYDALEPHMKDKGALSRIRDLLATPRATVGATAAERAAAGKVRDVLKETLDYRRAAGEDLGEVSDGYFPRVIEPSLVAADPVKFTAAATKLYRGIGLSAKDAADAADAWTMRVMDSYAGIDGGLDHVAPGSKPNSAKSREFGKAADVALKEFYQSDPFLTLSNYIQGSVKRAEETRRFGKAGAVGSPERAAWEKAHPDQTQWDVMRESIRDEVRASGQEALGVMDRVADLKNSNLGKLAPTNRFTKSAVSMLHTWNQLSKMDRVTVSSLGDLAMGFVRGGPKYGFQHIAETIHQFGRQVAKMKPDQATRYAEAIGTANDAFGSAVMLARTDANYMGAGSHQLIDKFYRGVGLQQLTDGGRIAATKTGQRFVAELANDLVSTDARTRVRAAGYLRELGVKDPDAFGQNLRAQKPTPDDILKDKGFAADYATAILRYVNQSIIMPSRAQKPTWANHPLGNLFFSLQGYSYGFKKNVLDRVGRETKAAITERDPRKLAAASGLAMLVGFQYLNDTYLRPAVFGSNYDFASETPLQAAMRTMDRAGILGPLSPLWNAFHPTKYNRGPAAALAGPIIGDIADNAYKASKWAFADNANTNTDERAAAGALYDTIVEPAADGIAAARLRGVARSAAILGTGQRAKNGILPADREAFVSKIAGEKQ